MISIIVAVAENDAIGKDNDLIWHISDDLKRFKRITTGHSIIMGRKTFESLPKGALPNRRNIVITSNPTAKFENAEIASSIQEALELVKNEEEAFVIGGGMIYKEFLPLAKKIYLSLIHQEYEADVFFPTIDSSWRIVEEENHLNHEPPYSYVTLVKQELS